MLIEVCCCLKFLKKALKQPGYHRYADAEIRLANAKVYAMTFRRGMYWDRVCIPQSVDQKKSFPGAFLPLVASLISNGTISELELPGFGRLTFFRHTGQRELNLPGSTSCCSPAMRASIRHPWQKRCPKDNVRQLVHVHVWLPQVTHHSE